ncbi:MAG: hypothetical protein ABJO36_07760 [Litorimonas sp.]
MAFFRKTKKSGESAETLQAKSEALHNQAKWDELERMVSEQNDASKNQTTLETETSLDATGSTSESFGIDSQTLSDSMLGDFASDLKIDMPTDSEFLDVTPEVVDSEPEEVLSAMAPSVHFETSARDEKLTLPENPKSKTKVDQPRERFVSPPPATNRSDRADIGAMRLDVARISADIQSGEELYRRAQQRIENLTGFVERAEIDFSMLNRLEPENRRLKARNRTIERELESNAQKMNVLRADLDDREQRLAERTRVYESTLGKLSVAQKSLQEYERALNSSRESSDRNALNAERLQTSLDVERRENEVLRERVTDSVTEMDVKQTAYIEAKKIADSLAQDCADYRHQAESAEKEADELRKSLATAQTQNNAMKAEMFSLHEDIRTFKSQSEFTIISREDEMTALQQQVDHLTKQLNIKDEIVRNAARDVQELRKVRTAQDLERERLEAQIENQAYQLDQANSEILKTKQDVTDFDRRYRDVATALSVAQSRRMSNAPAETPDIQPANPPAAPQSSKSDEFENLTGEEIEDRIMDFRLGLRSDIT